MHIAINAHLLLLGSTYRNAGIGRYIYNLIRTAPEVDPKSRYSVLVGPGEWPAGALQAQNLRAKSSRWPTAKPAVRILWEQAIQPWQLSAGRVDVVHGPMNVVPMASRCPSVVTVHDLAFALFPGYHGQMQRTYLTLFTWLSTRRARRVIAVSESTKADLVRLFGVPAEKVTVVHNGIGEQYRPKTEVDRQAFRRQKGLDRGYVLFVGTLEPRKNVTGLLRAYAAVRGEINLPLVVGGAKGWQYSDVFKLVNELDVSESVVFADYLPEEELPMWYASATAFVYPSSYEGFGLPPLEAMACGTPVISSNRSSIPEVVGDAGILVDPEDSVQIAEAIVRVVRDRELAERLAVAGPVQASRFTWRRTAEETVHVYEQAGGW